MNWHHAVNSFEVHIFTVRFTECMSCKLLDDAAPTTRVGYDKK